jgi:hypothetical protein
MSTDFHPDRGIADSASGHGRRKSTNIVNGLAAMTAEIDTVDDTILADDIAKERRDHRNLRSMISDGSGQPLKRGKDGVNLGRVEGKRKLQLGAFLALSS